jgi:hypothetical protein
VGIAITGAGYGCGVAGSATVADVGDSGATVVDGIGVGSKPWPDESSVPQPASRRIAISAMDRTQFMSDPLSLNQGLCIVYSSACVESIAAR